MLSKSTFLTAIAFAILVVSSILPSKIMAQAESQLPYYEISEYPDDYSAANVLGRILDGLGFRYYWATEGLTAKDLAYKPSEDARSTDETLDHIYGLTLTALNAVQSKPNLPREPVEMTFEEKRQLTLENIKKASDIVRAGEPGDMKDYRVIFERGGNSSEYPFWNMLNGPIADAIYHVGQVVSFRRSSGNPKNPKVSLFNGKLRQ